MHISLIFRKVVYRRIYDMVGSIIITLLQIWLQSVPVKEFRKSVNNWRRYRQQ